ncbi:MAG: four helix bundle protein [Pirellulales bacterium]|nr:four helix bundle protein [Pirellulales bacterium]
MSSNITEGQGRRPADEFSSFLSIAHGSVRKMETQVPIANRLESIDGTTATGAMEQVARVGWLIAGLMNAVRENVG